jgi:hypothetical protein
MAGLTIERCPETGICSIIRPDSTKVDLMPDEVEAIAAAGGKADAIQQVIAASDDGFASKLSASDLAQIGKTLV